MRNIIILCLLLIGSAVALVGCNNPTKATEAGGPSSEIPLRREFPVNERISPCENFYEHACSLVNSSFKLRDDRSSHTFAFSDSHERILEAKKKYLKELDTKDKLSRRGRVLRTVYRACMNEPASKNEEISIVQNTLKDLESIKTHKEFQTFVASKIVSKEFSFLHIDNIANHDRPEWDDVYIISDLQTLPERSYYDKPEVTKDFREVSTEFFKTIGWSDPEGRAKTLLDFEREFAQTYPLPAEIRDIISKKTEVARSELITKYQRFNLPTVLKYVPSRTKIRHLTPDNFEFLNKALEDKPLEVLKNVYAFHALVDVMDDGYPDFYKKRFDFNKKHLGGPEVRPVREERCTRMVMARFGKELDAELLPIIFSNFPEKKVVKLAEQIRESIVKGISTNEWLSPEARKIALRKIKLAKLQLVKPSRYEDWDFNPPARYSETTPYDNLRTLQLNQVKKMFRELHTQRNRDRWAMGPLTVNAWYSPSDNKFVLPIGILQYPFFDGELSDEANIAAMGMVIGHELGHAIDDKGSRYDELGRLKTWMTEKDLENFRQRGARLIEQFNGIGHNGVLTLGENVADLVGLTFAYNTAFPEGKGDPQRQKEFFLQYGRLWCNVSRPKYIEMLLKTDSHALGVARVNEQIKHQPAFKEVFNCSDQSPMTLNQDQVVRIW